MNLYDGLKASLDEMMETAQSFPRDLRCGECGSEAVGIKPLTTGEADFHCHCVKCKHEWFEKTAAHKKDT